MLARSRNHLPIHIKVNQCISFPHKRIQNLPRLNFPRSSRVICNHPIPNLNILNILNPINSQNFCTSNKTISRLCYRPLSRLQDIISTLSTALNCLVSSHETLNTPQRNPSKRHVSQEIPSIFNLKLTVILITLIKIRSSLTSPITIQSRIHSSNPL